MAASDFAKGFAPLWQPHAKVLVLGTLPSVKSLAAQQYYGHPQNAFWPIMAELLGFDPALPYAERCRLIVQAGVAVWDVLAAAERPGSLDADIRRDTVIANPIDDLVKQSSALRAVYFNGQGAAKMFRRHVSPHAREPLLQLPKHTLPSTSPAYAAMKRDEKTKQWATLLGDL